MRPLFSFSSYPLLSPERDSVRRDQLEEPQHHNLVSLTCLVFMAFVGYCSVTYQGSAGVNIWPRSTWKLLFALWIWKMTQQALTFYLLQIHTYRLGNWLSFIGPTFSGSFVLPKLMRWAVPWHCFSWKRLIRQEKAKSLICTYPFY